MVRIVLFLCALSAADRAWIDSALEAWRVTSRDALLLTDAPMPEIIFFDDKCTSSGQPHQGKVRLPTGEEIPAQVTSFTSSHQDKPFMVMALPSVWRRTPRHANEPALDRLTRTVFVHEMTHTVQSRALGSRIDALITRHNVPSDEVDDDIVQTKFGKDPAHLAAYEKERDLFYAAAGATDAAEQRRLLSEGLAAMKDRRRKFLGGKDAVYAGLEDVFLMMEGTANWAAYRYARRDMSDADAVASIRGGRRWWTQDEGLGIFLALDAVMPGWQKRALSENPPWLEDLLAEAVK